MTESSSFFVPSPYVPRYSQKFEGNDGEVTDVLWIRDGMAATGGSDRKVNLWNVVDGNASKIGQLKLSFLVSGSYLE